MIARTTVAVRDVPSVILQQRLKRWYVVPLPFFVNVSKIGSSSSLAAHLTCSCVIA
jgi:hypothetical protein